MSKHCSKVVLILGTLLCLGRDKPFPALQTETGELYQIPATQICQAATTSAVCHPSVQGKTKNPLLLLVMQPTKPTSFPPPTLLVVEDLHI
mmetsp:Transcript_10017/g.15039  ORF Transcript_10017/g.15039 Transcript_10017/m.15039 type:complete len:91 (+) Transcript_10017:367-639(+)